MAKYEKNPLSNQEGGHVLILVHELKESLGRRIFAHSEVEKVKSPQAYIKTVCKNPSDGILSEIKVDGVTKWDISYNCDPWDFS